MAKLAIWGDQNGVALTKDVLLAPKTIERYIEFGLPSFGAASRGTRRSMLLRVSEALLGDTAHRTQMTALPSATPSAPYSKEEMDSLLRWANCQSGERKTNARILLTLGIGAGLSATEIVSVRAEHVSVDADGTHVLVPGTRSRRVLVEGPFARMLSEAAKLREAGDWLFCTTRKGAGPNLISNFAARDASPELRPNSRRMRATWVVGRIRSGMPPLALMKSAGVQSLDALGRFAEYAAA